jgi:Mg/Co/Ni transporter MgtE
MQQLRVAETMDHNVLTIPSIMTVRELSDRIAKRHPEVSRAQAQLIVDASGQLNAIITRGDILRTLEREPGGTATVLEAGTA